MRLLILAYSGSELAALDVEASWTREQILVAAKEELGAGTHLLERRRLFWGGKELERDESSLAELGVADEAQEEVIRLTLVREPLPLVAVGCQDSSDWSLWSAETGQELKTYEFQVEDAEYRGIRGRSPEVVSIAFAPCGREVLVGCLSARIELLSTCFGEQLHSFEPPDLSVAALSKDGERILAGSQSGEIGLYDRAGELLFKFEGHEDAAVQGLAMAADGQSFLSAADDGTAAFWRVDRQEAVRQFSIHPCAPAVAISPDGKLLLTVAENGETVELRDSETGHLVSRLVEGHNDNVTVAAFSPDGKQVITGSEDCAARLWSVEDGHCWRLLKAHDEAVTCCAFSPSGKYALTAALEDDVKIWCAKTGKLLHSLETDFTIAACAFSPYA